MSQNCSVVTRYARARTRPGAPGSKKARPPIHTGDSVAKQSTPSSSTGTDAAGGRGSQQPGQVRVAPAGRPPAR
jgi:hypothetical protein